MSLSSEKFSYSSGSESDDDAPGEVSSSATRSSKLSQVRSDRQRDREVKEREREKRRNRNEMFTAQKKQKLESFKDRALPEDILEAVSSKQDEFDKELDEAFGELNEDGAENSNDSEGESGNDSLDNDSDEDEEESDDDDFIGLDPTAKKNALNVVTVEDPKKNTSSLEKALAFRNNRLYSGPRAPARCSAKKRRGMIEKKKMLMS